MRRGRAGGWKEKRDSSVLIPFVLRCTDLARGLLRAFGVDHAVFRVLLETRLRLDMRTSTASAVGLGGALVVLAILGFWLMGLGSGVVALLMPGDSGWVPLSLGVLMGMLGFLVLVQFVTLVVDPTDIGVVAPHPVPDRTLFAVRLAHVTIFVVVLVAPYVLAAGLLASLRQPVWRSVLVFPVLGFAGAATTTGAVALLLSGLLRVCGPSLFQRLTLWIQIATLAFMMGGLQLCLPFLRELEFDWEERATWLAWLPPLHFQSVYDLAGGDLARTTVLRAVVALLTPAALFAATLWLASRHFVAGLTGGLELTRTPRRGWRSGLFGRLGPWLARTRTERAGFDQALALCRRDPVFLRMGFPQIIGLAFMGFAMAFGFGRGGAPAVLAAPLATGFFVMAIPGVLESAAFTQNPEARWLYRALPVAEPKELLRGGIQGLFAGLVLPVALATAAGTLVALGPGRIGTVLLALELGLTIGLFFASRWTLPLLFTRKQVFGQAQWENLPRVFAIMGSLFAVVGLCALAGMHPLATWTAVVAAWFPLWAAYRSLERVEPQIGLGRTLRRARTARERRARRS